MASRCPLWIQYYKDADSEGLSNPEEVADAKIRARLLEIREKKRPTEISKEKQGNLSKEAPSPLWTRIYNEACKRKMAEPEKMANSAVRAREMALKVASARPKTLVTTEIVRIQTVEANTKKRCQEPKCKATTLEGRPCAFRALQGGLCKKHSIKILT